MAGTGLSGGWLSGEGKGRRRGRGSERGGEGWWRRRKRAAEGERTRLYMHGQVTTSRVTKAYQRGLVVFPSGVSMELGSVGTFDTFFDNRCIQILSQYHTLLLTYILLAIH